LCLKVWVLVLSKAHGEDPRSGIATDGRYGHVTTLVTDVIDSQNRFVS
jgi:hypothetical protein